MIKKFKIIPIVIALSLGLMACAGTDDPVVPTDDKAVETPSASEDLPAPETETTPETPTDQAGNDQSENLKPALDVFDQYQAEYPDVKFEALSLDKDFSSYVYKMEGFDGTSEHEFEINSLDGSLIKKEMDMDQDFEGEITREHVEKIESFVDKAKADAGVGATVYEWTLSYDDGRVLMEIEMKEIGKMDLEYIYDVDTGNLLEKDY